MVGKKKYTKNNYVSISLILTLVIGAILRFKGLTVQSYWLDELASAKFSNPENSFSSMYDMTVKDVHPPFYQILLWLWFNIFGFTEFTGRLLSAIIGLCGVYAIYLLGKELFNKQVGIYSSLIASSNYFLIHYSQEVRSYSLLFLFSTLSYVYFLKTLNSYKSRYFILYLVFTVLLLYTHYFGFFLVATQAFVFLWFFIKYQKKRKLFAILAAITAIVLFISILPLMSHILEHDAKKSFWIKKPSVFFIRYYYSEYFNFKYLSILFTIISLIGLKSFFHKNVYRYKKYSLVILGTWISIGYFLPYIRSIISIPLLTPRNTIIVLPALIVLIAYGLSVILNKKLRIFLLLNILILSIYLLYRIDFYSKTNKEQWREILYEVSKSKDVIPVYDIVFGGGMYENYAAMLNINLDIYPTSIFKYKYKEKSLPNCFWVIEAHGDWISRFEELKDNSIYQVLEIQKHNSRGVLYANDIEPYICKKKYRLNI